MKTVLTPGASKDSFSNHQSNSQHSSMKLASQKENINNKQQQQQLLHSSVSSNCSDSKLAYLESNLNRVCLQQDALMPLLQIVDLMPVVNKCDTTMKVLTKKSDDNETRMARVERILEQRLKEKNEKNPLQNTELGRVARTCDLLQQQFKDFEQNSTNVHRWFEAKLKEEAYSVSRALDVKLEKQKIEISRQINDQTAAASNQNGSSMNEQYISRTELEQFKAQLLNDVKEICFDKVESLKDTLTQEMRNIYKEIGGLRCEVEYISNLDRKERISQKLQNYKQLSGVTQQLQVNLLEQECFIQDLTSFNHENSFRIQQEIESILADCSNISENLNSISNLTQVDKKANDIQYLLEKTINLKYQSAGTKKKFVNEMKKIEEKFLILEKIKESIDQRDRSELIQSQLGQAKELEQQLGELMVNINKNLESDTERINDLEEELHQLNSHLELLKEQL